MAVAGVGLSEDLSAAALGSVGGNNQLPTPRGRAHLACDGHDQQTDIAMETQELVMPTSSQRNDF